MDNAAAPLPAVPQIACSSGIKPQLPADTADHPLGWISDDSRVARAAVMPASRADFGDTARPS